MSCSPTSIILFKDSTGDLINPDSKFLAAVAICDTRRPRLMFSIRLKYVPSQPCLLIILSCRCFCVFGFSLFDKVEYFCRVLPASDADPKCAVTKSSKDIPALSRACHKGWSFAIVNSFIVDKRNMFSITDWFSFHLLG